MLRPARHVLKRPEGVPVMKLLSTFVVALIGLCAAPAHAQDAPPDDGPLETARENVRSTTEWLARGVDSWFGDRDFREGGGITEGRLGTDLLYRPDGSTQFTVRFNARIRLPNIEQFGYFLIGRDNPREFLEDTPSEFSRRQRQLPENRDDDTFFAGLGARLFDNVDVRAGLRGGWNPFLQARYRERWAVGERGELEFRQTVFWARDERLGATTAASYDHAVSSTVALRWVSAATITQESRQFEWSNSFSAHKQLAEQRQLSLTLVHSDKRDDDEKGLYARWRQPVYEDWLLGEATLGYLWMRDDEGRAQGAAAGVGLQMNF